MIEGRTEDTSGENWYLVQIKPNSFRVAERALIRQKFQIFCPLTDVKQVKAGKIRLIKKPLFPGYLFVRFNPFLAPWRAINSTSGVSRIVAFGNDYPQMVPNALIAGLAARCDKNGHVLPVDALQPGDVIRVRSGPFAHLISEIENIDADRRIFVLLDILGRPTRVGLPVESVDKLG